MGTAPPTAPGRLSAPPREAQWPQFIGVVSIVFGFLGAAKSGLMFLYYALIGGGVLDKPAEMMPSGPGQVNPFVAIQSHMVIVATSELLSLALAILLIVVGFGIIYKHPTAITRARIWAVLKILVTFFGIAVGIWIQRETLTAALNDPNAPPAAPAFLKWVPIVSGILGGVASLIITCAWPVFLLIWLRRTPVRAETARWQPLAR